MTDVNAISVEEVNEVFDGYGKDPSISLKSVNQTRERTDFETCKTCLEGGM